MKTGNAAYHDQPATFRLWGSVEAHAADGRQVDMGTKREQCLLVGLIAARGNHVRRDSLLEWIWDDPPERAAEEIGSFMASLRKRLRDLGLAGVLINKGGLCQLNVVEESVDVHRSKALAAAKKVNDQHAAELLSEALRLTEGEPLAGLNTRRIDNYRTTMEADRLTIRIKYYQVEIRLGHYRERIGELSRLFHEHPDDAMVTALAMCALHFAGRQAEALAVYAQHRDHLSTEFGVDVSAQLQDLQGSVLRNEPLRNFLAFPLGQPYSSQGEPAVDTTSDLLVAIHSEAGSLDDVQRAVATSCRETLWLTRSADDCLICVVPDGTPAGEVIGVWMSRLSQAIPGRTRVGVAIGTDVHARQLAKSDVARRMLDAAPGSGLAVIVSDDVYQGAVLPGGRKVEPDSYRKPEGGESGWIRVWGHSTPPQPAEESRKAAQYSAGSDAQAGHTVHNVNSEIGKQVIATQINNSRW